MDEVGTGYQRESKLNILTVAPTPQTNSPHLPTTDLPSSSALQTFTSNGPTSTTDAGSYYHTSSAAYPSSPAPAAAPSDPVRVPLVRWPLLVPLWPFSRTCRPAICFSRMFCRKRSRDRREGAYKSLEGRRWGRHFGVSCSR